MGGEIGCNSVLGKGATFWFTARVGAATPVVAVLHANHEAAAPLAACFSGKVLVAEDNAVNQEVVQAVLRGCGCDVRIVGNGREALQAIQHEHFDLVLMDCQMPEMDGYAATRAVRAMQAQGMIRYMPIVALTAHATESDRQLCLDAGMDSVVTKPYTQAALRKELGRWLVSSGAVEMTGVTPQNNAASSDVGRENKAIVESKMNANTQGGGLDQSALDELRALDPDGSVGVFNEIIQSYLDESPAIIARMRAALAAANIGDMTNEAHSIKSSSYTVGAMRVGGLAAEIEAKGRANTIDGCHALVADLANQYAQDEKLLHACMAAPQR
jgi:CheY-like chemotaxis protein